MDVPHNNAAQQGPQILLSSPATLRAKRLQQQQALLIGAGRVLFFVCLIIAWQFASGKIANPLFISSPLAVVKRLGVWIGDGTLWFHTAITLQETLLGLLYGSVAGILAGLLMGLLPPLAKILDPFVIALYSIPKVALAPLFILWFGIGIEMKVVLAAVTVFFLVFINTLTGVLGVDQNLVNAVILMGGRRRDIVFKVMIPAATGYILTGLRIAIPYALIGAVIAELVASNRGLGYLINTSASEFDTAGVFAALLVLTIIAGILNAIVNLIDRKTSLWKTSMNTNRSILR
ncbi:MAG TPA: ABC transporter permease [Ktedonobacteraceae bacterium]|nr:ABC transporter permease [Ktedonobacteraceae bacterium]